MNNNYCENNQIGKVTYKKEVQFWDSKTGRYTILSRSKAVKFWVRVDYYNLLDGNITDIGRTFLLINSVDYNNFVCKWDTHLHHQVPLNSKEQLMKVVGISNRSTFKKFFDKLVKNNIIAEIYVSDTTDRKKKYKRFVINPVFGMKDKGITPSVFKLFHSSISPLISDKANLDLSKLVAMEEGYVTEAIQSPPKKTQHIEDDDSMTPLDIFHKYILRGKAPLTYAKNFGMVASPVTMDTDIYYLVNGTEKEDLHKKPSNDDISEYRSWFIDIDAGRDEHGKYFDDDEVKLRKQYMCDTVLKALDNTTPTLVVETRNGYHLYWSCGNNISADEWSHIELKLIAIVSVADKAVKDASRVMRLPDTMWIKADEGFAPFKVEAIAGTPVRYGVEDFEAILDVYADSISAACNRYLEKYPAIDKKKARKSLSKVISFNHNACTFSQTSEVITNVKSLNTSDAPQLQKTITDKNEARNIARSIDMASWLHIDNPSSFCCILPDHDDQHPSASIYHNTDHDRYFCHCCNNGKGLDSIDFVRYVKGCSYTDAVEYLCKIQGYNYIAMRRKHA